MTAPRSSGFSVVELALRRPYTFIVMAMLILIVTPFVLRAAARCRVRRARDGGG